MDAPPVNIGWDSHEPVVSKDECVAGDCYCMMLVWGLYALERLVLIQEGVKVL